MGDNVTDTPRVLIVSEHASTQFGGEAILPWHYFRILRRRGVDARLIVHSRTRDELLALLPADRDRMHFLPDTFLNIAAWKLSRFIPSRVSYMTIGYLSRLTTQLAARRLAQHLVARHRIDVVHQPIPVSPREPSLLYGLGAPVVIGPMNGDMSYPLAFAHMGGGRLVTALVALGRFASTVLNRLMPGKHRAAVLLVANDRTRRALPQGIKAHVVTLIENGVDLDLWSPTLRRPGADEPVRFIFLGRLIELKAVDALLDAFARVRTPVLPHLDIVGDGPMRAALEDQSKRLGLTDRVTFAGWQPQAECARRLQEADVLAFPSLHECGGAVVLEAMACALPVIATRWGGPLDYVDASCGILVSPDSREALVEGFSNAMSRLILNPAERHALGRAGRQRVERSFNWESKVDDVLTIYRQAMASNRKSEISNSKSPADPAPLVINCAFAARPGSFFEPHFGNALRWRHFSPADPFESPLLSRLTLFAARRVRAAQRVARCAVREKAALVITHDPRVTFVTEHFLRAAGYRGRHLAFSFNYPALPTGLKGKFHANAFRTVDRFVVYSTCEREMYHRAFKIPHRKLEKIHWGVNPPPVQSPEKALVEGEYLCALGENSRDYATLMTAMRRLPNLRLVMIVRPHNLVGLDVPTNVTVVTNVPLDYAINVLKFSRFMALPLTGPDVPCGHVTLVNAMHLGKAFAITRSSGVTDYVRDGENALMCAAGNVDELTAVIQTLWNDPALCDRLGSAGRAFAAAHCTEARTLARFRKLLDEMGVLTDAGNII